MFSEIKVKRVWNDYGWQFRYNGQDYAHAITGGSEIMVVEDMLKTMKDLENKDKEESKCDHCGYRQIVTSIKDVWGKLTP